jgi:hypothetical protein
MMSQLFVVLLNQSLPEAKRVKFNTGELRSAFFKPEDA